MCIFVRESDIMVTTGEMLVVMQHLVPEVQEIFFPVDFIENHDGF
jgi:hypothetical protein